LRQEDRRKRMARPYPPEGSTLLVVVIRNAAEGPVGVLGAAGAKTSRCMCAGLRCLLPKTVAVPRYERVMKAPSDPMPPPLVVFVFCWTPKHPK